MQCSEAEIETKGPIDTLPRIEALSAMLSSHIEALTTVAPALSEIQAAAELVAEALGKGATLHYAAAGSSGLMALADASELPGTFGVRQSQIRICMAGGVPVDGCMPGETEDHTGEADDAASQVRKGDVAIVVSASGTTPYALAFAAAAGGRGARVISIASVAGSPLLELGNVAIALETAPEVLAGSTRLGAGTAQKVVLNMISTQAGILLGHVHDGMMVNLNPDNKKLRKRAADIVERISGVDQDAAERALEATGYDTKLAVMVASGADIERARHILKGSGGCLRECLQQFRGKTITTN